MKIGIIGAGGVAQTLAGGFLAKGHEVMLGTRAGSTLVGLLTVAPEVFEEVAEVRIPSEVHERLVAWRLDVARAMAETAARAESSFLTTGEIP